jgi:hypothetical protein
MRRGQILRAGLSLLGDKGLDKIYVRHTERLHARFAEAR